MDAFKVSLLSSIDSNNNRIKLNSRTYTVTLSSSNITYSSAKFQDLHNNNSVQYIIICKYTCNVLLT